MSHNTQIDGSECSGQLSTLPPDCPAILLDIGTINPASKRSKVRFSVEVEWDEAEVDRVCGRAVLGERAALDCPLDAVRAVGVFAVEGDSEAERLLGDSILQGGDQGAVVQGVAEHEHVRRLPQGVNELAPKKVNINIRLIEGILYGIRVKHRWHASVVKLLIGWLDTYTPALISIPAHCTM